MDAEGPAPFSLSGSYIELTVFSELRKYISEPGIQPVEDSVNECKGSFIRVFSVDLPDFDVRPAPFPKPRAPEPRP